ncbi:hypothetical protein ACFPOE_13290 [Caenimonas terrae]|uniref:Uncharacterized protein n=1 Tax=Caenimonas terrae TaxID=696074 RepID=A0ABW0NF04_9BURK
MTTPSVSRTSARARPLRMRLLLLAAGGPLPAPPETQDRPA